MGAIKKNTEKLQPIPPREDRRNEEEEEEA